MEKKSPIFDYIRKYWDWANENPEKSCPSTAGLYFYLLNVANHLNWKPSFSITSTQVCHFLNVRYNTYKKYFDILVEAELILIVKESRNQFSANIIALSNFDKALDKPRGKASENLEEKQSETSSETSCDIHKTINTNNRVKTSNTTKADLEKVYSENQAVNDAFIQFLKHRIEIKKPATQRAADMLYAELKKLCSNASEAVEIINTSIMNGWQSFYKPKSGNKSAEQKQFNRSSIAHYS